MLKLKLFIFFLSFVGSSAFIGAQTKDGSVSPEECVINNVQHIVFLGDSNTWLGGDDCSKEKGWNYWLCKMLAPQSARSYARSGATWTHTVKTRRNVVENVGVITDDNVIYNQVCRLIEAVDNGRQQIPDLIFIAAGTNDAWFTATHRPQAFSGSAKEVFARSADALLAYRPSQLLTLHEAVRYNGELLQRRFPAAHIVLLTPLPSTAIPLDKIVQAGRMIAEAGDALGLTVIPLGGEEGICACAESKQRRYTYDGTHTGPEGARKVAEYVASWLKKKRNK